MPLEPMTHAPTSAATDAALPPIAEGSARADEVADFTPPRVDLDQARAEVGALDVFRGRGAWVWEMDGTHADSLATMLKQHRFRYLMVKAHQSTRAMNAASVEAFSNAAAKQGLAFGIWGYLTAGADVKRGIPASAAVAAAEAQRAVELVRQHDADFYVANAEVEYRDAQEAVSRAFADTFRRLLPSLPAALSSFGRVDFHPDLDWKAWWDYGFEFHPQAYQNENRELSPALCVEKAIARGLWPATMIRPSIGAYKGALGRPTPKQLADSLRTLPTQGFAVYRAGLPTEASQPATAADYAALALVPVAPVGTIPSRPLALTSPHLEGADVFAIQAAVNRFHREHELPPIDEDGEYGPISHEATVAVSYYLGVGPARFSTEPVRVKQQRAVLDPSVRTPAQVKRGEKRLKELDGGKKGAAAAVAFAQAMIGTEEQPLGSNRGPRIDAWGKPYESPQRPGEAGWDWCGIFAGACLAAGGLGVPKGIVWTPAGLSWAINGVNGFEKGLIAPRDAKAGDLVYFDWKPGSGESANHVGIVERNLGNGMLLTIEGNTSPEQPPIKGSDYGVFRRHRSRFIAGCARPRYPS
jgi:hypothetical protein